MPIPPTPGKSDKWTKFVADVINRQSISHAALEGLIGKLRSPRTSVFPRCEGTMTNPTYSKLYSIPYFLKLTRFMGEILKCGVSISTTMPRMEICWRPGDNAYIIHTDAACGNNRDRTAAVICDPESYRGAMGIMGYTRYGLMTSVRYSRCSPIRHLFSD